ncbi:RHS repeat-associated core domain-containing protein, partial [Xanthomonas graminis]
GNRLSAKVNTATQSYTYPTTNHRLSAVAGTARTYDAIGNTLSIGGTAQEFAYDATGRMSQAKRAGTVVMYNGRGEQVRRADKTNTYTLYDESGHWLGTYDANGAGLQQAIWLDDLPVGVLAKNSLRYVQPDHLGTPRAVIDPTRDVAIWKWDLKGEAFGTTSPDQDPDKDGTAFVFDMRFPGQRYDAATGLNQNYFRDYDAGTGRYGQSDPIGLRGGFTSYAYAASNPLAAIDSLGLRDVVVVIWRGQVYPFSVGHVFVGETNGDVILSQFPLPHATHGTNMTYDWYATLKAEGRQPDSVWKVSVPNDRAFDSGVENLRDRPFWDAILHEDETNCSVAAYSALESGGGFMEAAACLGPLIMR